MPTTKLRSTGGGLTWAERWRRGTSVAMGNDEYASETTFEHKPIEPRGV